MNEPRTEQPKAKNNSTISPSLSVGDYASCTVDNQSGTITMGCNSSVQCYADVTYSNGIQMRVWGGCGNLTDCSCGGSLTVNPCP